MSALEQLKERFHDIGALNSAVGLLSWDQQVLMPPGGREARGEHMSRLSRMRHEKLVSDETRRLLEVANGEAAPGGDDAALVRVIRREVDTYGKLPTPLVEERSRVSSEAYQAWRQAKAEANFSILAPYLEQLFDIARRTAEELGYQDHIYDPLIDLFEEGATYQDAKNMFEAIKGPIQRLVLDRKDVDDSFCYGDWDQGRLRTFAESIARQIGFDFGRGRLDLATNAFCSGSSKFDIRMTTRPARHLGGVLFSTLHEMGHGLYEQNSPSQWDRTPLSGGISLGVHESQSRTWENIVGRSRGLWEFFYPALQNAFPDLKARSLADFVAAVNKVEPGPIRIGSDELTYNFHILVRFEMECDILTGAVPIKDIPEAWNEKYRTYLGITPQNDSDGCLQDVHWSRGSVGYFPTYSMGNMISWQVWHTLQSEIPDTDRLMARCQFEPILGWLTENIYSQAKRYTPRDLITRVTGKSMGPDDYLMAMSNKYGIS